MTDRANRNRLLPLLALLAIALGGCGATTEPESNKFRSEHTAEAERVATATKAVGAAIGALGSSPSKAQLEALAVDAHKARRALLAADGWNQLEDGEEEGVSQAEREIHEGAGALLTAMSEVRLYSQNRSPAALAAYRTQLAAGREYWNQGITQLWYIAKKPNAPRL